MQTFKDSLWEKKNKEQASDKRITIALVVVCVFLVIVMFLNFVVFVNVRVDGSSMYDTLADGDVLTANKLKTAERGDIIVISTDVIDAKTGEPELIIKRLIGKSGDVIEIIDGEVYRNGEKLIEPYVDGITGTSGGVSKWEIKEGEIFFLGDNRAGSEDSRGTMFGTQKESAIIGVIEGWSIPFKEFRRDVYNVIDTIMSWLGFQDCTGTQVN